METGNDGLKVEVDYGSDLDASEVGSALDPIFHSRPSHDILTLLRSAFPATGVYARSGWNISNLPNLDKSVMSHLRNISGITIPWIYIGHMFSSFAWHVEDHNCYSINYNHYGAPKQATMHSNIKFTCRTQAHGKNSNKSESSNKPSINSVVRRSRAWGRRLRGRMMRVHVCA